MQIYKSRRMVVFARLARRRSNYAVAATRKSRLAYGAIYKFELAIVIIAPYGCFCARHFDVGLTTPSRRRAKAASPAARFINLNWQLS